MSGLSIPEAAYEAAVLSARRGLQVGARFLVAHELERLFKHAFGEPDDADYDYYYACESLADAVRDRISELRGETVE